MPLNDRDIIQVDATVIAGALILLTLTFALGTLKASELAQQTIRITLAMTVTVPFALSAIFVIWENMMTKATDEKRKAKLRTYALGTMFIGFAFIIILFGFLMSFYTCPQCWSK
ncbi:MAG TPA: hypothetical protein VJ729_16625 [Nitrososphaeraceae archaeon]|nr:hypothetical protein [Nitrososphaeraceae archaeon]